MAGTFEVKHSVYTTASNLCEKIIGYDPDRICLWIMLLAGGVYLTTKSVTQTPPNELGWFYNAAFQEKEFLKCKHGDLVTQEFYVSGQAMAGVKINEVIYRDY